MGVNSRKLYKAFLDDYEVAAKSVAGSDAMKAAEDVANMCFSAGEYVGYNAGFKSAIKAAVKGLIAGVVVGKIAEHFVKKAIEENEGEPVTYGPITISKNKED